MTEFGFAVQDQRGTVEVWLNRDHLRIERTGHTITRRWSDLNHGCVKDMVAASVDNDARALVEMEIVHLFRRFGGASEPEQRRAKSEYDVEMEWRARQLRLECERPIRREL